MKIIKKIFSTFLFTALILSIPSCKEESDSVSYVNAANGESYTFVFNNDSTFAMHYHFENSSTLGTALMDEDDKTSITFTTIYDYDVITGSYEGNPRSNGEIQMTVSKKISAPDAARIETKITQSMLAGDNKMTITNDDYPMKDVPSDSEEQKSTGKISGKTLTIDSMTFNRR